MICHRLQLPLCTLSLALLATVAFAQSTTAPAKDAEKSADAKKTDAKIADAQKADGAKWIALPTTADGPWESCNFGGDGEIEYKDGVAHLGFGDPLTGIRLKREDFPKENFEIELQARRTSGFDFFCGLTFPVGEGNVSFVLGGWSGGVVGISSIDDQDASENETTDFKTFKNDTWFTVRARVDEKKIQCWIDDKQFVDVERGDHKFSIRNEMDPSLPVGVAAFQVTSEIRNVRWRKLTAKDKAADKTEKAESEETATGGNDS